VEKRPWRGIEAEANSTLEWYVKRLKDLGRDPPSMPPIPIREICALKGLSINAISGLRCEGKKLAGMLDASRRAISFEATDILGRQHFSVAHELGHYALHWLPHQASQAALTLFPLGEFTDETFNRYFRCTRKDMELTNPLPGYEPVDTMTVIQEMKRKELEYEANKFAEFMLMPAELVKNWARQLQGDRNRLAYQFEVSPTAMDIRLEHLGMRKRRDEEQAQRYFFLSLANKPIRPASTHSETDESDSTPISDQNAILITPHSRLRTLVSEINTLEQVSDNIALDFSLFEETDLRVIGPEKALDVVLLNDYVLDHIIPIRAIAAENLSLSVKFPNNTSFVSRHLSRLGVFDYLRLGNGYELASSLPRESDTASNSHILIRLTRIEAGIEIQDIAQNVSGHLLNWMGQSDSSREFADFIELVTFGLARNIIQHSGTRPGSGKGYLVAQLDPMARNDQVTGYRVVIAAGDIGIGVRNSLAQKQGAILDSDLEALRNYLDGPTVSQLRAAITEDWQGHLQLNSGDAMLSVGTGSTSYLSGLDCVPGLQITILATYQM
jgi:Zn-dependent peptidase ImmA (M78 family)